MTKRQTARTHRTQCSPPQEDYKQKSQTRKTTVSPPPAEEAGRKLRYQRSRNGRKNIRNRSNRSSSRNGHKGRRSQWSVEITTDCSFTHNTWRSQQAIIHWKLQEKHCKYLLQNKQFAPSTSYQDGEKPIDNSPKLKQKQSTDEQSNANSNWRIDKRNPILRIHARLQLKQEYYYKTNIAPTSETNTLSKER